MEQIKKVIMKKQIIRLTESDLHKIIKESVNRILMESSKFDEYLEKELSMPYEARQSQMTDEEIMGLLDRHKQEQMDYDAQQEQAKEMKDAHVPDAYANHNVKDDRGNFSGSAAFLRGDYDDVPL